MAKYEIMLILDPKEDINVAKKISGEIFKNAKFEKLEKTELAYEINKSKTGTYILINVESNGDEIKEFTRKTNIVKTIWRSLVINLDTEMGREKALAKMEERAKAMKQDRDRPRYNRESRDNINTRESRDRQTKKGE